MDDLPLDDRYALLFPGQGPQHVGMGRKLAELSQAARQVFAEADEILGFHLSRLCFEGPEQELNRTLNTQPAVLTTSIAAFMSLQEKFQAIGRRLNPAFVAGHSFGEFAAAIVVEALDFADGLKLVQHRARLMQEAQEDQPGGMISVIGLDEAAIQAVCSAATRGGGILALAVDNGPRHIVLSGDLATVDRTATIVQEMGGKAVRLPIGVGAHSPLMRKAAEEFARTLSRVQIERPAVPIVSNVTAAPLTTSDELRRELIEQFVQPVQWAQSVREMINQGVSTFVEVGPGNILSRLVQRISENVRSFSLAADPEVIARIIPPAVTTQPAVEETL